MVTGAWPLDPIPCGPYGFGPVFFELFLERPNIWLKEARLEVELSVLSVLLNLFPKATAGTDMDAVRALSCMCEADDKDVQEESFLDSSLVRNLEVQGS